MVRAVLKKRKGLCSTDNCVGNREDEGDSSFRSPAKVDLLANPLLPVFLFCLRYSRCGSGWVNDFFGLRHKENTTTIGDLNWVPILKKLIR